MNKTKLEYVVYTRCLDLREEEHFADKREAFIEMNERRARGENAFVRIIRKGGGA